MASASDDYEEDTAVDPRREIKRFVRNVETPGTFAWGSSLVAPNANLTVQGLGNIALPLTEEGVGALRGAAELAPFGHGAETKVDEKVRQAWQIDAERMGLSKEFAGYRKGVRPPSCGQARTEGQGSGGGGQALQARHVRNQSDVAWPHHGISGAHDDRNAHDCLLETTYSSSSISNSFKFQPKEAWLTTVSGLLLL